MSKIETKGLKTGADYTPLIIGEIGINHTEDITKSLKMVDDTATAGCECLKIQTHVVDDEMIPNKL